jgi:hypothetical protein
MSDSNPYLFSGHPPTMTDNGARRCRTQTLCVGHSPLVAPPPCHHSPLDALGPRLLFLLAVLAHIFPSSPSSVLSLPAAVIWWFWPCCSSPDRTGPHLFLHGRRTLFLLMAAELWDLGDGNNLLWHRFSIARWRQLFFNTIFRSDLILCVTFPVK